MARHLRRAMIAGSLAVAAGLAGGSAPASARVVLEVEAGRMNVEVDALDRLAVRDGRRFSQWQLAESVDPEPDATALVGPALSIDLQRLATRRHPLRITTGLACASDGSGVAYAWGTAHRSVWRVVAETSDGRRSSLFLVRPPRTWGTSRKRTLQVFGKRDSATQVKRVQAYDDDDRLLSTLRIRGAGDCAS